jgi:hypothetical protein
MNHPIFAPNSPHCRVLQHKRITSKCNLTHSECRNPWSNSLKQLKINNLNRKWRAGTPVAFDKAQLQITIPRARVRVKEASHDHAE